MYFTFTLPEHHVIKVLGSPIPEDEFLLSVSSASRLK